MNKKTKYVLYIGILIVILLTIFLPRWFSPKEKGLQTESAPTAGLGGRGLETLPVNGYLLEPSYISTGIRAAGSLVANEEVDITTEISGMVVNIYFQEGNFVKEGDLLMKMYDEDLQAQLQRATYQQRLIAERLERQKILLTIDAVSREGFEQVQTDYDVLEADIRILKLRIAKTEIRAPFSGTVGFRYVSEGSYIQANSKVARLTDKSSLKVEFSIPEKYIALDLMAKNIVFQTEGFKDEFQAKVYAIDPQVDTKTRSIALRARYENRDNKLFPGMYATVTLIMSENNKALQLPSEAIVPEMDGMSVWLVQNGIAISSKITTGIRSENMVEVLSGLHIGDTIITSGLMQLRPNMPVEVTFPDAI